MSAQSQPIDRKVARQAAGWFLRLQAADATAQEHQACADWRRAHGDHERAWQLAQRFNEQLHQVAPTPARAALYRNPALSRRTALKALTSLVVLGSLGTLASRSSTWTTLTADISTGVGERRQLVLSDGTELFLNTDTALDIRYSEQERTLILRKGEVLVQTAADNARQTRPFSVHSSRGQFLPLGTRFLIRQFDDHDELKVLQGAVSVAAQQGMLRVEAGQQAWVGDEARLLAESRLSVDWAQGVLRVERMRLADFVAELGRYRHGWTRCEPEVADLLISGTFQLSDTDNALQAVALTLPVKLRYVTRYWVALAAV